MYRSFLILIALAFTLCACNKPSGGSGTSSIRTGPVVHGNGGINFGGWHTYGGDHTQTRHVKASGPAAPEILWVYDYTVDIFVPDGTEISFYVNEPLVDADGNIYVHVSWMDFGADIDFSNSNDTAVEIAMVTESITMFGRRPGYLLCLDPQGSLKWITEFEDGDSIGYAIMPAGYIAIVVSGSYIPEKQLEREVNAAVKKAAQPGYDPLSDMVNYENLFNKMEYSSAIHLVKSDGSIAGTIERRGHSIGGVLVTSGNQLVTTLTEEIKEFPDLTREYTPPATKLAAFSIDGRELWSRDDLEMCRPIAELPNHLLLCETGSFEGDGMLVALDSAGATVWDFKLPEGSLYHSVVDTDNKQVLLFRQHHTKPEKNKLYCISFDGQPLAKHEMPTPFRTVPVLLGDGSIVTQDNPGHYIDYTNMDYDKWESSDESEPDKLSRYSPEGELLWTKDFGFAEYTMGLISDIDGVLYMTYGEDPFSGYLDDRLPTVPSGVMAISNDGEIIWHENISDYEFLIDLAMGPDGTLICAADTKIVAIGERK